MHNPSRLNWILSSILLSVFFISLFLLFDTYHLDGGKVLESVQKNLVCPKLNSFRANINMNWAFLKNSYQICIEIEPKKVRNSFPQFMFRVVQLLGRNEWMTDFPIFYGILCYKRFSMENKWRTKCPICLALIEINVKKWQFEEPKVFSKDFIVLISLFVCAE